VSSRFIQIMALPSRFIQISNFVFKIHLDKDLSVQSIYLDKELSDQSIHSDKDLRVQDSFR
jgi:hypothetical protein